MQPIDSFADAAHDYLCIAQPGPRRKQVAGKLSALSQEKGT
jgi:hypothetical protein